MKPLLLIGLCACLIIGCSPATNMRRPLTPMQTALIRVECTRGSHVEQTVKQILRSSIRVNDWDVTENESFMYISARYEWLSPEKAAEIKERLQESPWVLDVDIRYDGVPVKNIR